MLVAIVYDSGYGHSKKQAEAVRSGVLKVAGAEVRMIAVRDEAVDWKVLEESDAIIFGSPTYNGMASAKLKQFFEDSTKAAWSDMKWRNKIGAGFTNSAAQNGDKLNTLVSMALFAAQHGMIWVGLDLMPGNNNSKGSVHDMNRLGSWLGAMAQSNNDEGPDLAPIESDLKTAAYLGERVAGIAKQFKK